jgi:ATP-binding cassette, subfamily G (WHITE), member 2
LFDTLYLLAAGVCVYHGPADNVLSFFSSVGFTCEEHDNPADFILDISQHDRWQATNESFNGDEARQPQIAIETYLNESYLKTDIYQSIEKQISEYERSQQNKMKVYQPLSKSLFNEMFYVSQRTLRNAFRNPALTILQSAVSIILALLIGLIYLSLDDSIENGIPNRSGAIFFIVTNQVFSNLSALDLFIKERILFVHENVSGYYHVMTYFLSKILCDILPLRTIPAIGFSLIAYFMMGFQRTVEKFFIFLLGVWITSICSSALCFFVSASVRNFGTCINIVCILSWQQMFLLGIANLVAALFCVLTLIFSGFLVKIKSVLSALQWIQYFSIFRYSSNILLINEFDGLKFCSKENMTTVRDCSRTGDEILTSFGITYATNWDLWQNFVALGSMAAGFLFFAYIQLRFMKKTK